MPRSSLLCLVLLLGCDEASTLIEPPPAPPPAQPPVPPPPPPPQPPPLPGAWTAVLEQDPAMEPLLPGTTNPYWFSTSLGSLAEVVWTSNNPAVLSVSANGRDALVTAVSSGTAIISASAAGLPSASREITVAPLLQGAPSTPVLERFVVVEHGEGNTWSYFPQLSIKEVGGGGADILRVEVLVPGSNALLYWSASGARNSSLCTAARLVPNGRLDLFAVWYGEYVGWVGPGSRATESVARAVIHYSRHSDRSHPPERLEVSGPIVAGGEYSPDYYIQGPRWKPCQ